jgi:putative membrane protein
VNFVTRVVVSALAVWITTLISSQVRLASDGSTLGLILSALIIGLVLTLVNMIFRPVIKLLSMPLYFLTFGLFSFVVNGLVLWIVAAISRNLFTHAGLEIAGGFTSYIWVSIVLALVQVVVSWFAPKRGRNRGRVASRPAPRAVR